MNSRNVRFYLHYFVGMITSAMWKLILRFNYGPRRLRPWPIYAIVARVLVSLWLLVSLEMIISLVGLEILVSRLRAFECRITSTKYRMLTNSYRILDALRVISVPGVFTMNDSRQQQGSSHMRRSTSCGSTSSGTILGCMIWRANTFALLLIVDKHAHIRTI